MSGQRTAAAISLKQIGAVRPPGMRRKAVVAPPKTAPICAEAKPCGAVPEGHWKRGKASARKKTAAGAAIEVPPKGHARRAASAAVCGGAAAVPRSPEGHATSAAAPPQIGVVGESSLVASTDHASHAVLYYADLVSHRERARICNANLLRVMLRDRLMPPNSPDIARTEAVISDATKAEKEARRGLVHAMKSHPLGSFVARTPGLGALGVGRWLGLVGDPAWNALHGRPRTLPELYAWCGLHVVNGHRAKSERGVKSNWNRFGKTRALLMVDPAMKDPRSSWYAMYKARRAWTDGTHPEWSKGHSHADARSYVAKRCVKMLWMESCRSAGN